MKPNSCKGVKFQDCELSILRMAVDSAEEKIAKRIIQSSEIKDIIQIVEDFIKKKSLICYGGTAINNILPSEDQFYNKEVEIPDYDFFSPNALKDTKELADIYYEKGFEDVEAKSGQHHGTYKVFVNYIPVADISQLPKEIYDIIKKDGIRVGGILYTPPNYLRMSMYLELSRPVGDTSRWEKVLKRLTLLNKHYPITNVNCSNVNFQRIMEGEINKEEESEIYKTVRNTFIHQGVVFFGGYAISLYSQYMPEKLQKKLQNVADFDVLSNDPETTALIVEERLKDVGIKNAKIIHHSKIGDVIPEHIEIQVGDDTVAFIYKPIACHSYNVIKIDGENVKIATIDTMLSFYLAFLYVNKPYYSEFSDRIVCMSQFLFNVQQKNRLEQKGLLKRFSITCYGHQETVEEMRAQKAKKYKELKHSGDKKEYDEWFLNYQPANSKKIKVEQESYKEAYDKKYNQDKEDSFKNKNSKNSENFKNKIYKNKNYKNKNYKNKKSKTWNTQKKKKINRRKTRKYGFFNI